MLIDLLKTLGCALAAVIVFMTLAFILAQRRGRYDVADIAWGLVFIVIVVCSYTTGGAHTVRPLIMTALVSVWGLRLAAHIYLRFRRKSEEDHRYTELRDKYKRYPRLNAYLKIFLSQGLLALVITLPVTLAATTSPSGLGYLDAVGAGLWVVGFFFEALGDAQLTDFLSDPRNRGKLMTSGLWHITRHPNYFGEVTQWWGIGLIALSAPWGWIGLAGPVLITTLILFVSGVPLLEKNYAGRKDWDTYKRQTSVFVPWFPRRK